MIEEDKILILTVGLPRSGKSTWAIQQNLPIVNRDSIRLALYNQPYIQEMENFVSLIEQTMVKSLFNAGHNKIILDATHLKMKYIESWKEKYLVELKYFDTPIKTCKQRAIDTNKEYLIDVIDRMINECDVVDYLKSLFIIKIDWNKVF